MTEITKVDLTPEQVAERAEWSAGAGVRELEAVQSARRAQYVLLTDPLFFGWQRGDNTEAEWLSAVEAVKVANPYPAS